jgi:hypothetical protein
MGELRSTGWFMPSENLYGPAGQTEIPADCEGPHTWERFSTSTNCCSMCEALYLRLECSECLVTWSEPQPGSPKFADAPAFAQAWESAPWG